MQQGSDIIIPDTSCLILLDKIDELNLLKKLNRAVRITDNIRSEFGRKLPEWINTKKIKSSNIMELLSLELDIGEASAIALAMETMNSILIIDDLKGRKVAEKLGLNYSGTLGLLLFARNSGIIKDISIIIDKIRATNFRISEDILTSLLKVDIG